MATLRQDLAYALRTFRKAPVFTLVAVLVLGVGIGANTAIFTIVNQLVFTPLSGRAGDLVGVYSHDRTETNAYRAFSYPNYADIREQSGIFDGLLAHSFAQAGVPAGDMTRRTFVQLVSSNYFDTLGVSLAAGRPFTLDEERPGARIPVAIVPFARRAELGSTLRINARDYTVVGVAPEGFTGTMAMVSAEVYLPLGVFDDIANDFFRGAGRPLADRDNPTLVVAGQLKPGVTPEQAAARLDTLSRQLEAAYPAENRDQALTISPLPRMSSSTRPASNTGLVTVSVLLLSLSGIVLVIACLNVANMLLARGAARSREIAVRLAVGAARVRVIRQLLTEGLLLAGAGAILGLLLGFAATRALAASLTSLTASLSLQLQFHAAPDWRVVAATIGFAAVSTIAFGLGPALRLSRRDLVVDLKDRAGTGAGAGRRFGARNLMVVAQVALSLVLLTAGGVFTRTTVAAAGADPGFSYDRLYIATVDGAVAGYREDVTRASIGRILDKLRRTPGVESAALTSNVAFSDTRTGETIERVGVPDSVRHAREFRVISADYFRTIGVPLLRGREFTEVEERSADAPPVAIIDDVLARRMFGDEDPIGQMIRSVDEGETEQTRGVPMQIVGVVPTMRVELIEIGPSSHLYVPYGSTFRSAMHIQARLAPGHDEIAGVELLRKTMREADAALPVFTVSTMQAFHDAGIELWMLRTAAWLFSLLGGVALLLAVVGVYGVKSYVVAQRTREIGIRMALGAAPGAVVRMMLADGLLLTGGGVLLGVPLAIGASMVLASVFAGLGGVDPWVVAPATMALAVAAAVATIVPSRRAARIAPLEALRE